MKLTLLGRGLWVEHLGLGVQGVDSVGGDIDRTLRIEVGCMRVLLLTQGPLQNRTHCYSVVDVVEVGWQLVQMLLQVV